jgi:hypothetical protein
MEHREADSAGILRVITARSLDLDDFGPHPLGPDQVRDILASKDRAGGGL